MFRRLGCCLFGGRGMLLVEWEVDGGREVFFELMLMMVGVDVVGGGRVEGVVVVKVDLIFVRRGFLGFL